MSEKSRMRFCGARWSVALSIAVWVATSGTGHAAPKPITVWLYGDGESSRMYSELQHFAEVKPGAVNRITVLPRTPMNSSGPDHQVDAGFADLDDRILFDLMASAYGVGQPFPNVIHIGYNASAKSYANCAYFYKDRMWEANAYSVAEKEAQAIKRAADVARTWNVKVLLTLGPGSPTSHPIAECMNLAFKTVTLLLYFHLGATDPYVDYSGTYASIGTSAADLAFYMDPAKPQLWQADGVHVSCDRARFEPGTAYSNAECLQVASETDRRARVGAWRLANTTLKSYQYFQNL